MTATRGWRRSSRSRAPQATTGIARDRGVLLHHRGNEYAFALMMTNKNAQTVPPLHPVAARRGLTDWTVISSGSLLFLIPVAIFTFLLRKHLLRGVTFRRDPPLAAMLARHARQFEAASMAAMLLASSSSASRERVPAPLQHPRRSSSAWSRSTFSRKSRRRRPSPTDMADIQIIDADKAFGSNHVIRVLNLEIHQRRRVRRPARAVGLR